MHTINIIKYHKHNFCVNSLNPDATTTPITTITVTMEVTTKVGKNVNVGTSPIMAIPIIFGVIFIVFIFGVFIMPILPIKWQGQMLQ